MIESLTVCVPKVVIDRTPSPKLETFERVTGIKKTRRWPKDAQSFLEAGLSAAREFIPLDVESVIVVTQSPARLSPCNAMTALQKLGIVNKNIPAFDVNQSCTGFIYGAFLASQMCKKTLVICYDMLRYTQGSEEEKLIFSDALSVSIHDPGIDEDFAFLNDPSGIEKLHCHLDGQMKMDGGSVFDFVTSKIPPFITEFQERRSNLCDWLVQHQANLAMNKIVEKRSGFEENSLYCIEEYGNQSMVSIPTCLAINEDKILGSDLILAGFGAGWSAALAGITWNKEKVSRIIEI